MKRRRTLTGSGVTSATVQHGLPKSGASLPPPQGGRPWRSRGELANPGNPSRVPKKVPSQRQAARQEEPLLDWSSPAGLWESALASRRHGAVLAVGVVLIGRERASKSIRELRRRAQELRSELRGSWGRASPGLCTDASLHLAPAMRTLDRLKRNEPAEWTAPDVMDLGAAIDDIMAAETELHSGLSIKGALEAGVVREFRELLWGADQHPLLQGEPVDLSVLALPPPTAS